MSQETSRIRLQRGDTNTATLVALLLVAVVAAGVWAVYQYGDGQVMVNGRSVEDLQPWEVVGAVIIGIIGLVVGLAAGAVGLVIGLVGAVLAIVVGFIGVAAGLFITAGVLLGPFLLIAAIFLLFRRRGNDDA